MQLQFQARRPSASMQHGSRKVTQPQDAPTLHRTLSGRLKKPQQRIHPLQAGRHTCTHPLRCIPCAPLLRARAYRHPRLGTTHRRHRRPPLRNGSILRPRPGRHNTQSIAPTRRHKHARRWCQFRPRMTEDSQYFRGEEMCPLQDLCSERWTHRLLYCFELISFQTTSTKLAT
jgi:hypothetical protein